MTARAVLLHGLAGSPEVWQPLVQALGGRCPVEVRRLPWSSTGSSDWAQDPHAGVRAIAGSYMTGDVVVAHSFAATLLLAHLAGAQAPRPDGVVLVSPFYRSAAREFTWDTIHHFVVSFHEILAEGVRAASHREIAEDLLLEVAIAVRNRIGPYAWTRFFEAYLATPGLLLTAIRERVHVVHGLRDEAAPVAGSVALAAALPDADLLELATSAHFPMLDQPDVLAGVVLRAATAGDTHSSIPEEALT